MIITVGGPPGSGKTTVARELAKILNYKVVIAGEIFREMAKEKEMDLLEFGEYARENPEVDHEIDNRVVAQATEDTVLEGRLAGAMLKSKDIKAFKVFIDAKIEIRVQRVCGREFRPEDDVRNELITREQCERERYLNLYHLDMNAHDNYDLIIDNSYMTSEETIEKIIKEME